MSQILNAEIAEAYEQRKDCALSQARSFHTAFISAGDAAGSRDASDSGACGDVHADMTEERILEEAFQDKPEK